MAVRQSSPPLPLVVLHKLIIFWIFRAEAEPVELSLTVFLAIHKLSDEKVAVGVDLNPSAVFVVAQEHAFEDSSIFGDGDAWALSFFPLDLSKVDFSVAFDQFEVLAVEHFLEGHAWLGIEVVVCKKIAEVLLRHGPDLLDGSLFLDGVNSDNLNVEANLLLIEEAVFFGEGDVDLRIVVELLFFPH